MVKLDLTNPFTFETADGTELSGTFRDLYAHEVEANKKKSQKYIDLSDKVSKLYSKIARNEKRIRKHDLNGEFDEAEKLEEKNEALQKKILDISKETNPEIVANNMLKERFELCLGGKDRDTILKIGEEIGYRPVFEVIQEAIKEGKQQG